MKKLGQHQIPEEEDGLRSVRFWSHMETGLGISHFPHVTTRLNLHLPTRHAREKRVRVPNVAYVQRQDAHIDPIGLSHTV